MCENQFFLGMRQGWAGRWLVTAFSITCPLLTISAIIHLLHSPPQLRVRTHSLSTVASSSASCCAPCCSWRAVLGCGGWLRGSSAPEATSRASYSQLHPSLPVLFTSLRCCVCVCVCVCVCCVCPMFPMPTLPRNSLSFGRSTSCFPP